MSEHVDVVDRRFAHYVLDNARLETIATGFRWVEGLVWMADANCLLFQDLPDNRTMRWIEGAGTSVYRAPSHYANGQTRDRQGRLVACSHRDRCLYRTEFDGTITKLVDAHGGKRLNSPNDVVVKSDGSIWFTDPLYGIANDYEGGRQVSEQPPALYRFDPVTGAIRVMAADFAGPNGLAFSPDETRLYVAESGDQTRDDPRQVIRVFDVSPDGSSLSGGGEFHKIVPGYCDGMRVDEDGNVWSSAADGVHCLSPQGELLGAHPRPAARREPVLRRSSAQSALHRRVADGLRDLPRPSRCDVAVSGVERLARVVLNSADADRLATFYVDALGFERLATHAGIVSLALGATRLDLRDVGTRGSPYPDDVAGWNPLFQHCAIVVTDMALAMRTLTRSIAWRAITIDGPQTLPANTGGVTAFKFRDPEGHPLELLVLPDSSDDVGDAPFVRIDHSAISVADVARGIAFYAELGLSVAGRTLNVGIEQQRLDAVDDARVDVVSLALPSGAKPHVELLGYRGHRERPTTVASIDDIAATRLVFRVAHDSPLLRRASTDLDDVVTGSSQPLLRDPDGHVIEFEVAPA